MTRPTVSVVIVSRGRAADLPLCLLGVSQLVYPSFEVVLVVDPEGHAAAHRMALYDDLKIVPFDEPNISAARNLGIAEAAGEIIAFIDDDAVPEPTWLAHLVAGFADPEVAACGGYVRGRNGISFQWKARTVDQTGAAQTLDLSGDSIAILSPQPGRAIKTEGTNMAVRRDALVDIGGFDPAFRFYLDETDVNMRLAAKGTKTAIAPLAQVHHGYKASAMRRADRAPRDLFEIGASQMVYLRKHASSDLHDAALAQLRAEQHVRLDRLLIAGLIEPRDFRYLLKRLNAGIAQGRVRSLGPPAKISRAPSGFTQMQVTATGHEVLTGRIWQARSLHEKAMFLVQSGKRVSVFILSWSRRPHSVRFTHEGFWLQTGGLFGRANRSESQPILASFKKRFTQELQRVAKLRGLNAK